MIIDKLYFGKGKTWYAVCNDVTETGNEVKELARFKDLPTAVMVLKYIRGDELNEADTQTVKTALMEV